MGKLSNAALRLTTGALVLDAGIKKLGADEGTYAYLQQMAASGVPAVAKLDPKTFGKLISYSETALGATLLTPFIPARLAGAGLTAFSANLMTMYFRNPDMHDKAFRPTQDGQQLANNIVMLGAGLALLFSDKKK